MEVSMPTGSLCAERNVIGSALADDITLRRQDLKVICVYSARSLEPVKELKGHNDEQNNYGSMMASAWEQTVTEVNEHRMSQESIASGSRSSAAPGGGSSLTVSFGESSTAGANSSPSGVHLPGAGLSVDIPVPAGRDLKRRWSETSAASNDSNGVGSPGNGSNSGRSPRSPVLQGQKRKILSMPNQPISTRVPSTGSSGASSSSSGGSGSGASNSYLGGSGSGRNSTEPFSNIPQLPSSVASALSTQASNKKNTRKIRSSFSSGGLLGLDRHEIFNMGDEYERETEITHHHTCGINQDRRDSRGGQSTTTSVVVNGISSRSFMVSESDMNPLKPCGACTEWLKKIASVNPQFTVVTFTDYECEGVYLENIVDT